MHSISDIDEIQRMGLCSNCGPVKIYSQRKASGAVTWSCSKRQSRGGYRNSPERRKLHSRRSWTHGLSDKERTDLVTRIGECEICGTVERLCVDHCHETGEIRGVLCANCNSGLGFFKDNPKLIEAAATYLNGF